MKKMKEFIKKIIPPFLLSWYHFILALFGAFFYRFPSRLRRGYGGQAQKIKVIGVTGTNGKSTVVELASKILEEAGYKVASLSSIKFKIGEKEWPNTLKMTMPGRFKIQKFLRQVVNSDCQYAVLEVTSEGIKQHRHRFINFEAAVFTNLTPEHIEVHGSFEKYRQTKGKLFQVTKNIHVINLDDENAEYFLQFPANKKFSYRISGSRRTSIIGSPTSIIEAKNIQSLPSGLIFSLDNLEFNLKLLGKFNIYNALAAVSVGLSQGISLEICKKAVEKVKGIPGRMEEVISQPFKVFVDYAFTPAALEKVYQTIKNNFQPQKMICVLGACGGGRDKWKRPVLGEIAARYCNEVIVTNEDPYDENPLKIMEDIESGFSQIPNSKIQIAKYEKILDRRKAIGKALSSAKRDDIVIITGKGCEPWICVARGKKIPWDDRQVVKEELEKLKITT